MHDPSLTIYRDAFSSGQISSKIWLCNELENLNITKSQIIWVYGGWYGIASFLLLSREKFRIKHIRSFDIDPKCADIADAIMENWVWQGWRFKAATADCNIIDWNTKELPDLIINCSTEHFKSDEWFQQIPAGTMIALQSNNMPHDDHHSCFSDLDSFENHYQISDIKYRGQLDFNYPTWSFSRFMLIGVK